MAEGETQTQSLPFFYYVFFVVQLFFVSLYQSKHCLPQGLTHNIYREHKTTTEPEMQTHTILQKHRRHKVGQ